MAPGVFFVCGTLHLNTLKLEFNRTFILELKHFPGAGISVTVNLPIRNFVRSPSILVVYSTETPTINGLGAVRQGIGRVLWRAGIFHGHSVLRRKGGYCQGVEPSMIGGTS